METGLIVLLIIFGVILLGGIVFLVLWLIARSKGKIDINLEKLEYSPGETIKGTIKLTLKKPVEATELDVGLLGQRRVRDFSSRGRGTRTETIFEFKKPIDNSGQYIIGEKDYPFELQVPSDVLTKGNNPVLGSLVNTAQAIMGGAGKTYWYITSNLDMKGFDISKKIRVNLG